MTDFEGKPDSGEASSSRSIFLPAKEDATIREGSLVILYLSRDMMSPLVIKPPEVVNTRYGQYRHSAMIGRRFGSKMVSATGSGFCFLLRPTPELWSLALPHRTQILYMPDIAFITSYLDIKPGDHVAEAGTGSGSFTHALARTVGKQGKVFSFEFHEERCLQAGKEFQRHGLDDIIALQHRNVCKDGFGELKDVDCLFLDLPAPWEAIPFAKDALARDRMTRICCFSPCIEQVIRTVSTLREHGFSTITMYETLVRQQEIVRESLPTVQDAIDRLKSITAKKSSRRLDQIQKSRQDRDAKLKRKAGVLEEQTPSESGNENDPDKRTKLSNGEDHGDLTEPSKDTTTAPEEASTAQPAPARAEDGEEAVGGREKQELTSNEPAPGAQEGSESAAPKEDLRGFSVKPAVQGRGHTSYLTFAFLLPPDRENGAGRLVSDSTSAL